MRVWQAALACWLVAAPAMAQGQEREIRPSKVLGTENATTIPGGTSLWGFNGAALGTRLGLSDGLELAVDLNSVSLTPALALGAGAGLKYTLYNASLFGAAVDGTVSGTWPAPATGAPYGASLMLPMSFVPSRVLRLNLQPRVSYAGAAVFGADLGLGYHLIPQVLELIGQASIPDATAIAPTASAGLEYFGFGPRTTVGARLITYTGTPGVAYAATLYQGL